jgi:hypothetical protein
LESLASGKPIADPWFRKDQRGPVSDAFNLLSQMANMNPQGLDVSVAAFPDLGQQVTMREHLAFVQHEFVENTVLSRGQLGIHAADLHHAAREIDAEMAIIIDGWAPLHLDAMAQGGADARHELRHAEWLRDKVIGAGVKRCNLARFVIESGQDDDGRRARSPHRSYQVCAIAIRQAKIKHGEIQSGVSGNPQRAVDIFGFFHIEAFGYQRRPEEAPDGGLVIDDQSAEALA